MSDNNLIVNVRGTNIRATIYENGEEYICLTDIAKTQEGSPDDTIRNWLRLGDTVKFLGIWESLNNPNFNSVEYDGIKLSDTFGTSRFTMSVKQWVQKTNAIGLSARTGKYNGGTYAQRDIALEFCSWLSPEFKLYLIKEFQRLKEQEFKSQNLDWNLSRFLSSVNYRIHTDSIKQHLLPELNIKKEAEWLVYAEEADILNYALFNKRARDWKVENPEKAKTGNIRDFASVQELIVMANLESFNSRMVKEKIPRELRLQKLREQVISELISLAKIKNIPDNKNNLFSKTGDSENRNLEITNKPKPKNS